MEGEDTEVTDYHDYLKSEEWQKKREQVLTFWGNRCALCYSPDALHVHHRCYHRLGQELITDLIVLCEKCHDKFHGRRHGLEPIQDTLLRMYQHG